MRKTLGQINYEGFTPEWVTPLVPWHEVPAQEQRRWEAAAQAAGTEAIRQWVRGQFETVQLREAVIEAARAWAATAGNARHHTLEDLALYETIEALDAAEKGGK